MYDDYGSLKINLEKLLEERKLTKNRVSHLAEMSWSQVDNYCNNVVTRLDVLTLCKLCTVLDCKIEDLLEFIPSEKEKSES